MKQIFCQSLETLTKIAHERVTEGNLEEKWGRSGQLGEEGTGEQRDLNGFVVRQAWGLNAHWKRCVSSQRPGRLGKGWRGFCRAGGSPSGTDCVVAVSPRSRFYGPTTRIAKRSKTPRRSPSPPSIEWPGSVPAAGVTTITKRSMQAKYKATSTGVYRSVPHVSPTFWSSGTPGVVTLYFSG